MEALDSPASPPPLRSPAYWLRVAGLAAAYCLAGWIAFHLGDPIDYAYKAILWPPVGLGVFALLVGGERLWPGIALGELVTTAVLGAPRPLETHLVVAAGATLEVVAAAWLFRRVAGRGASLQRPSVAVWFIVLTAGLSPLIGALVGTIAFVKAGIVAAADMGYVAWAWWSGDAVSVLILTPWLLAWREPWTFTWTPRRLVEFATVMTALSVVSGFVFAGFMAPGRYDYPLTYMPILLVAWMAARFGFFGATTATLLVSAIAVGGTLRGGGPFQLASRFEIALQLQAFLILVAATMLLVTALVVDRRRAELELTRRTVAHEKARELERLKDDLLNATTHELRTPIAVIMGNAELLEDMRPTGWPPAERALLEGIQQGADRLERMVDDLLLVAQLSEGAPAMDRREVDLAALAEEVVAGWRPCAERRGVRLALRRPERPVWAALDETRVAQALDRLLDNALKFTPAGGDVEVTVEPGPVHVEVAVQDTGAGVPPEASPRLFERFFQGAPSLTRRHGGAGLGLAIVKAIAEAHGGRVGVESRPGRGSRFWLRLPVHAAIAVRPGGVTFLGPEPIERTLDSGP